MQTFEIQNYEISLYLAQMQQNLKNVTFFHL